jgi:Uma2 family endonuclease
MNDSAASILEKPSPAPAERARCLVLSGMNWDRYEKMLDAVDGRNVRVTYDRGEVELMSPLPVHEAVKVWFGQLMTVVAMELDIAFKSMGSTTIKRRDLDRGLEPDDCYYFANAAKVRDWTALDLSNDPPPDLALEIDITNSSLDRMSIYAALRVPEVWRFDGEELRVYALGVDGSYQESATSVSLPFLPLAEITPLLEQGLRNQGDDRPRLRAIREWCRQRLVPLEETQDRSQNPHA